MRRTRFFALLFLFLFLIPLLATPAKALSIDDLLPDLLDAIPGGARDELDGVTEPEAVGQLLGLEYLASVVLSALSQGLSLSLGMLGRLLSAVLLCAILALAAKHLSAPAAYAAECGIAAVLCVSIFLTVREDVALVCSSLADMRVLSDGLIPLFATLFAAGGSAGTAAAAASGFATFSYFLSHAMVAVLSPMLYFLFALSAISALGAGGSIDGLLRTVKGLYLTLILFLSVLLVTSLGFQTTLSASADSLAAGSVRFAIGNLIPVVGGTLGGSLRTLASSLSLVRSTLGTLSLASLLLSVLPVLISLLLHRFFLSLASDAAGMLGAERARRTLDGFRSVYDLAAALLAVALVLFFLILGILCHTVTAIG